MSSKSKRGSKRRGIPGYRPGESVIFTAAQVAGIMLDGIDCPYCSRRVLDDGHPGLYVCECGWSGGWITPGMPGVEGHVVEICLDGCCG